MLFLFFPLFFPGQFFFLSGLLSGQPGLLFRLFSCQTFLFSRLLFRQTFLFLRPGQGLRLLRPILCVLLSLALQCFISGIPVEHILISQIKIVDLNLLLLLLIADTSHQALRGKHSAMLHDARSSRLIQHRDQRLSDPEVCQHFIGLKGRIDAEGICRCLDIFHIRRGVGVQCVLNLVSQLGQHFIRHILWALGDKVNAHALGADQFHHLFDLIPQCFGNIVEQQMRFVKEEHHPRFLQIPHFRQDRVQF